jgi:hypothetical protein
MDRNISSELTALSNDTKSLYTKLTENNLTKTMSIRSEIK